MEIRKKEIIEKMKEIGYTIQDENSFIRNREGEQDYITIEEGKIIKSTYYTEVMTFVTSIEITKEEIEIIELIWREIEK